MKLFRLARFVGLLSLMLVAGFAPVIVVNAAPTTVPVSFQDSTPPTLPDLLQTLQTLGGVAMFFTAVINAGKKIGWVSDGQAPGVSLALNTLGLVTLVGLQLAGKLDLVPAIDQTAGQLAVVINAILALVFQLYISRKTHESVLAGLPLVGESHSGRNAGEGSAIQVDV